MCCTESCVWCVERVWYISTFSTFSIIMLDCNQNNMLSLSTVSDTNTYTSYDTAECVSLAVKNFYMVCVHGYDATNTLQTYAAL